MNDLPNEKIIGRNEPCPCNSGKKYKRCCGVDAAPKVSAPRADAIPGGFPGGMSAEQMRDQFDPQMMLQFSQMLGKLPKGQLQKLQSIMQKAMAGKDVTREARELEDSLPLELQTLLQAFQMPGQMPGSGGMPGMGGMPEASSESSDMPAMSPPMSEEEARKIVEAAAKEGKISSDQASSLLESKPGISKLWKKISGK
jgi:polyhydroxyalkanoate synthesis regulator phasin